MSADPHSTRLMAAIADAGGDRKQRKQHDVLNRMPELDVVPRSAARSARQPAIASQRQPDSDASGWPGPQRRRPRARSTRRSSETSSQRQRPPRGRWQVAERSGRQLEEDGRTRRDEHRGDCAGDRSMRTSAEEIRRPRRAHRRRWARPRRRCRRPASRLEDRHDDGQPWRIRGRDRLSHRQTADSRAATARREQTSGASGRQQCGLLPQRADAPEMSLAYVAVRVGAANNERSLGQANDHHARLRRWPR